LEEEPLEGVPITGISSESRHETLTKQLPACYNSGAFSETTEGALFLTDVKDERSPLKRGGFSCFSDTPTKETTQGGVLRGYGDWQPEREGYGAGSEGVVAESLERSYPWAVGFFFGSTELSVGLWNVIAGVSGFDD